MSKFEIFMEKWGEYYNIHKKYIRKGQALSNVLNDFDVKVSLELNYTHYDCFYNDDIIPDTIMKLKEMWNDK